MRYKRALTISVLSGLILMAIVWIAVFPENAISTLRAIVAFVPFPTSQASHAEIAMYPPAPAPPPSALADREPALVTTGKLSSHRVAVTPPAPMTVAAAARHEWPASQPRLVAETAEAAPSFQLGTAGSMTSRDPSIGSSPVQTGGLRFFATTVTSSKSAAMFPLIGAPPHSDAFIAGRAPAAIDTPVAGATSGTSPSAGIVDSTNSVFTTELATSNTTSEVPQPATGRASESSTTTSPLPPAEIVEQLIGTVRGGGLASELRAAPTFAANAPGSNPRPAAALRDLGYDAQDLGGAIIVAIPEEAVADPKKLASFVQPLGMLASVAVRTTILMATPKDDPTADVAVSDRASRLARAFDDPRYPIQTYRYDRPSENAPEGSGAMHILFVFGR